MGRTAESKLERAESFDKTATKISKRDPESARELRNLARTTRKSAIKQLKRRPKRRKSSEVL